MTGVTVEVGLSKRCDCDLGRSISQLYEYCDGSCLRGEYVYIDPESVHLNER